MGSQIVSEMAARAKWAARTLAGIDGASISLGCHLEPAVVEQLSSELGGHCNRTVLIDCSPAVVSVAMLAIVGGVDIAAQGRRPIAAGDAELVGWSDSENRRATEDEVRAAVGAP